MRVAIVWTGAPDAGMIRQLLAAAGEIGAERSEIWLFSKAAVNVESLPVTEIIHIPGDGPWLAERIVPPLSILFAERQPSAVLFWSGTFSNTAAARFAHDIKAPCALCVERIIPRESGLLIHRRILGMNLVGEFVCPALPLVVSVATGAYDPVEGVAEPNVITADLPYGDYHWCDNYREAENSSLGTIAACAVVLVGGRGIGGEKGMNELRELGELLQAGAGSTRPVALDGVSSLESIIGVSGLSVSPKLCLVFGTSGSTPFIKGIEKSGCIVAINDDPEAMIFKFAHVGIVDDCASIITCLKSLVRSADA